MVPGQREGSRRSRDREGSDRFLNNGSSAAEAGRPRQPERRIDEQAKLAFLESAFSDAVAIYILSLALDFDYADLREREYPLLAAPALAERLRHIARLFPPNPGYEFQVLYRRR
jgi:hypothetical protein